MSHPISHKQKLIDLLQNCKGATILDYGCGRGDFINILLNSPNTPSLIVAADSDPAMIECINQSFSTTISQGRVITKTISTPTELQGTKFDNIICHNVLECVDDKLAFINAFKPLFCDINGVFILSHHDFDSAIFNSAFKILTRNLVHHFADTQQKWQEYSDGQMGRKIPGLMARSAFRELTKCETWRLVDNEFIPGTYGYLMADMLMEVGKGTFNESEMISWRQDLIEKNQSCDFYFAIDLVVALCECSNRHI